MLFNKDLLLILRSDFFLWFHIFLYWRSLCHLLWLWLRDRLRYIMCRLRHYLAWRLFNYIKVSIRLLPNIRAPPSAICDSADRPIIFPSLHTLVSSGISPVFYHGIIAHLEVYTGWASGFHRDPVLLPQGFQLGGIVCWRRHTKRVEKVVGKRPTLVYETCLVPVR